LSIPFRCIAIERATLHAENATMRLFLSAIVGVSLALVTPAIADAGMITLAAASNVFSLGNVNASNTPIDGPVTAAGDVTLNNSPAGSDVTAGGSVSLTGSPVGGNVQYGGTFSADAGSPVGGSVQKTASPFIDFGPISAGLRDESTALGGLSPNGTVVDDGFGDLTLTGSDPTLNVFDVTPSAGLTTISIGVPAGATALVNFTGSAVMGFSGVTWGGTIDPTLVLFNFPSATSLSFSGGATIDGSVLAPFADLTISDGSSLQGSAMAQSVSLADSSLSAAPFAGSLDLSPVPEPSSLVLLSVGGLGLAGRRRWKAWRTQANAA
jgi:choice-of-anchor A domain-containing protein